MLELIQSAMPLLQASALLVLSSLVIMKACDVFEQGAGYAGRNMSGGARGAIVDAIGSSLPELMVTMMFVMSGVPELILAGVAVTAGSAVFNSVLIPSLSIFSARDEDGNKVDSFELSRKVIFRDGAYLLAVEGLLIYFLGMSEFTLAMAGILIAAYVLYVVHVLVESSLQKEDKEDYEYESLESEGFLSKIINFDVNALLFKDKPLTTFTATVVILTATAIIGVACHYLAVSVEGVATAVGVPVYFSAVVLGAAATSVPDTVLSIKSAKRGEGQDAVSNAIGSNIFDVTVSLGLPIAIYLAAVGGTLPIEQSDDLTMLRWFVLGSSFAVIAGLFLSAKKVGKSTAWFLLSIYAVWIGYIAYSI